MRWFANLVSRLRFTPIRFSSKTNSLIPSITMMSFSKADFRRKSLWFNLDAATLSLIRSSSLSETKNLSCFARFRGIENGSFPRRLQRELRGNPLASYFVAHEVCTQIGSWQLRLLH